MVSVVPLDRVHHPLAALHPQLDQLGEHLEDLLARAHTLLFEDGWGDAAKFESKVVLLPVPPPRRSMVFVFGLRGLTLMDG